MCHSSIFVDVIRKITNPSEQPVPRLSLETETPEKRGRNANQSPAKTTTDFIFRICDRGRYLSTTIFFTRYTSQRQTEVCTVSRADTLWVQHVQRISIFLEDYKPVGRNLVQLEIHSRFERTCIGPASITLHSASFCHVTPGKFLPRYTLPVSATLHTASFYHATLCQFLPRYTLSVSATLHTASFYHATLCQFLPRYTRQVPTSYTLPVSATLHTASFYHATLCQFLPRYTRQVPTSYTLPISVTLHSVSLCHATLESASTTLHSATSCHATLRQFLPLYICSIPEFSNLHTHCCCRLKCLALVHQVTPVLNYVKSTTYQALQYVTSSIHPAPLYFQTLPSVPSLCVLPLY